MHSHSPLPTPHLLRLALGLVLAVTLVACHRDGLSREQRRARRAAERCYAFIQRERYADFVSQIAYADQMSPEYRAQLCDLVHESAARDRAAHGPLLSATAVGDTLSGNLAHVYLQLVYADSTSEEVGVPMVCIDGDWMMQ